jgi:hypothetical protein
MTPQKSDNQSKLFEPLLESILNDKHPLYKLASSINWEAIEKELACCYSVEMGRPGNATTIGYKRIVVVPETTTSHVRVRFDNFRLAPTLAELELY